LLFMTDPGWRVEADVFADYCQFYLWDKGALPNAPVDWSERDVSNRLKVEPNVVVVFPVRNMTVPVRIEVFRDKPNYTFEDWDHVAECSLELGSGTLELHESCDRSRPIPFTRLRHAIASAERMSSTNLSSFIWSVADLLRGDYKQCRRSSASS
jgi:hypothetical protein